ncbi:MAG: Vacuolar fusion protein mon1 [Alyxoria varia]|nr:MAG: Vacuolar fusion protein mon1 [Alyxoria varia]
MSKDPHSHHENLEAILSTSSERPFAANSASDRHDNDGPLDASRDPTPPPLPPRPHDPQLLTPTGSLRKPKLQSRATTAVSLTDVQSSAQRDVAHRNETAPNHGTPSRVVSRQSSLSSLAPPKSRKHSDSFDVASVKSFVSHSPTARPSGGTETLLEDALDRTEESIFQDSEEDFEENRLLKDSQFAARFEKEFVELERLQEACATDEELHAAWSQKLKHFLVLSSAGKPIWSRHGDDQLISETIGIVQTIISFYQDMQDTLKSFVAGDARFVVLSKGHLYLVAISRLSESDTQLRSQLEGLYMQILSTLTLPNMERLFLNRPSTDLRRPLQGTETLLAALADGFTRGSPSTLLSALESLRIRKTHRVAINNTLVRVRDPSLLYGLLIAGSRLVSVIRPRKHSLHPVDLHLIFNMLFEAKAVRAGGGENWVPLCLPGFNNTGYVYMYVSFLNTDTVVHREGGGDDTEQSPDVAVVLISTSKESFYDLRVMRDHLIDQFQKAKVTKDRSLLDVIHNSAKVERPSCTEIAPGTPIRHFLFKSRTHVQFVMPSASPLFSTRSQWRRLISRYAGLHAAVHGAKWSGAGNVKVIHSVYERGDSGLAWVASSFELYAIAAEGASKAAVAKGAERIVRWARQEEERLFLVGGAIF